MRVLDWREFLEKGYPGGERGYSGSVGSFDGVHLGHGRLLEVLKRESAAMDGSVVVTFRENPKRILKPESFPGDLSSLSQRLELLDARGIDYCVLISYDREFGAISGGEFLDTLIGRTGLKSLIMGQNARMGAHAAMDADRAVDYARKAGISAQIVPSLVFGEKTVSSSRIRLALLSGKLAEAAALLGHPYEIDVEGWASEERDGRISLKNARFGQLLPPRGGYEAECRSASGDWKKIRLEIGEGELAFAPPRADGLPCRLRFV